MHSRGQRQRPNQDRGQKVTCRKTSCSCRKVRPLQMACSPSPEYDTVGETSTPSLPLGSRSRPPARAIHLARTHPKRTFHCCLRKQHRTLPSCAPMLTAAVARTPEHLQGLSAIWQGSLSAVKAQRRESSAEARGIKAVTGRLARAMGMEN
jgi:hypothetical protein